MFIIQQMIMTVKILFHHPIQSHAQELIALVLQVSAAHTSTNDTFNFVIKFMQNFEPTCYTRKGNSFIL